MKESFEELYTRLYNENIQELEKLREKSKKETTKLIMIMLVMFVSLFIPVIGTFIFIALMGLCIIIVSKGIIGKTTNTAIEYRGVFKEKIIIPLINNIFDNGTYEPDKGWTLADYEEAEYNEKVDKFDSEDMVTVPVIIDGDIKTTMQFAEVHTQREGRDKNGSVNYTTIFYGLMGKLQLNKDISTRIYIKKSGMGLFYGSKLVRMDMPEFEEIFDVVTEDKNLAVRILTADVMTEMIDLYNQFQYRFEINVINNMVYTRIHTGEVFEPNIFKNSMEYKTLEKYYKILQAMTSVSKHIYNVINEIEI